MAFNKTGYPLALGTNEDAGRKMCWTGSADHLESNDDDDGNGKERVDRTGVHACDYLFQSV